MRQIAVHDSLVSRHVFQLDSAIVVAKSKVAFCASRPASKVSCVHNTAWRAVRDGRHRSGVKRVDWRVRGTDLLVAMGKGRRGRRVPNGTGSGTAGTCDEMMELVVEHFDRGTGLEKGQAIPVKVECKAVLLMLRLLSRLGHV